MTIPTTTPGTRGRAFTRIAATIAVTGTLLGPGAGAAWAGGRAFVGDFGFDDARESRSNLAIREGTHVKLRMCCRDEARPVHCSRLQRAVA
jgi:hypothetical protein